MDRVRLDKWLWAARFFKTRTLAARACELGRIQSHGQPIKASREVHVGDLLSDLGQFRAGHVEDVAPAIDAAAATSGPRSAGSASIHLVR